MSSVSLKTCIDGPRLQLRKTELTVDPIRIEFNADLKTHKINCLWMPSINSCRHTVRLLIEHISWIGTTRLNALRRPGKVTGSHRSGLGERIIMCHPRASLERKCQLKPNRITAKSSKNASITAHSLSLLSVTAFYVPRLSSIRGLRGEPAHHFRWLPTQLLLAPGPLTVPDVAAPVAEKDVVFSEIIE